MRYAISTILSGIVLLLVTTPCFAQQSTAEPNPQTEEIVKAFSIQHGDAIAINQVIEKLFGTNDKNADDAAARNSFPILTVRSAVDERTNSIIVSGSKGDLEVIEDFLERMDEQKPVSETTRIYRLQNAPAEDVASAINHWLEKKAEGSRNEESSKKCIVVPELVSNSLIVSTSLDETRAEELDTVIRSLDVRPKMIQVDMVIKRTIDGKETIISSPRVVTIEGLKATARVGSVTESWTVELTPRITPDGPETEVTTVSGGSEKGTPGEK